MCREVVWSQHEQESEASQHQNLIHGYAEATTKPKPLRPGLLDKLVM